MFEFSGTPAELALAIVEAVIAAAVAGVAKNPQAPVITI
jgi:hypothetical protein